MKFFILMYSLSILADGCTNSNKSSNKFNTLNQAMVGALVEQEELLVEKNTETPIQPIVEKLKPEGVIIVAPSTLDAVVEEQAKGNVAPLEILPEVIEEVIEEEEFINYKVFSKEIQNSIKDYVKKTDEFQTLVKELDFDNLQKNFRSTVWNKMIESQDAFDQVYTSKEAKEAGSGVYPAVLKVFQKRSKVLEKLNELNIYDYDNKNENTRSEIFILIKELNTLIQDVMVLLENNSIQE